MNFSLVCNYNLLNCSLEAKQNLLVAIYAQSNKAILDILDLRGEGGKPVKILGNDTNKTFGFSNIFCFDSCPFNFPSLRKKVLK